MELVESTFWQFHFQLAHSLNALSSLDLLFIFFWHFVYSVLMLVHRRLDITLLFELGVVLLVESRCMTGNENQCLFVFHSTFISVSLCCVLLTNSVLFVLVISVIIASRPAAYIEFIAIYICMPDDIDCFAAENGFQSSCPKRTRVLQFTIVFMLWHGNDCVRWFIQSSVCNYCVTYCNYSIRCKTHTSVVTIQYRWICKV